MLGENIRILRKEKGLSQETFAQQLNVVRQTVSKWEKGLSVPDAEMLNSISELFEVPVSTLLGSTITEEERTDNSGMEEVAKQLAILNEQLANRSIRRRRTWKRVLLGILISIVVLCASWVALYTHFRVIPRQNAVLTMANVECTLDGETYYYGFLYDENFRIWEAGGDSWLADHVLIENYSDANVAIAQIETFITDRGGTIEVTREPAENEYAN